LARTESKQKMWLYTRLGGFGRILNLFLRAQRK